MVQLSRQAGTVWVMLVDDQPIGQVVAPTRSPVLGPGGDTVLLRRPPVSRRPAGRRVGLPCSAP
jgi:hypothetical protein